LSDSQPAIVVLQVPCLDRRINKFRKGYWVTPIAFPDTFEISALKT